MLILQTLANAEIKELFLPVSRPEVAKIRQKFQILFCKMLKNKSYHEKVSCEWSHHRDLVCYIRLFFSWFTQRVKPTLSIVWYMWNKENALMTGSLSLRVYQHACKKKTGLWNSNKCEWSQLRNLSFHSSPPIVSQHFFFLFFFGRESLFDIGLTLSVRNSDLRLVRLSKIFLKTNKECCLVCCLIVPYNCVGDGVWFPDTKLKVDKRCHLSKESIVQRDFPLVSHLLFIWKMIF